MASPTPPTQHHHPQGLPSISSLTNEFPRPSSQRSPDQHSLNDSTRDSGTWQPPQSKPNNQGLHLSTLLNPDDSPPRQSIPSTPQSARIPVTSQTGNSQLPSINQGFQHDPNRDSRDYAATLDSRRSSVDSRMHQGFNNLYINNNNNNTPQSPYESANTSQVSLAASLRRPNGVPMSPLSGRSSVSRHPAPRVAPPIMPVGRMPGGPDPTAAKPTQGFAWAFPDQAIPEERRTSDSGDSSVSRGVSRQNSFAASSIRSSIFSTDSHLPPGQRRFDEGDATTHHHSMQHRSIQGLQNDAQAQAVGNYSRTPELRVSHKLAERKRRSEMKDLFEDLNKAVPANGGTKASKWEILTKAIDYIRSAQHNERQLAAEVQRLQREADYAPRHKDHSQAVVEYHFHHSQIKAQLDLDTGTDLQLQELQCKESSMEDTEDEETGLFRTFNPRPDQSEGHTAIDWLVRRILKPILATADFLFIDQTCV
ncbi:hypothetical protein D0864_13517 [Hortaea werneckii]|uniref:BHLH domain-containing protein n=1 Tax=Hortaea werneckii TaxID=91943 RepID=A0A3M7CZG7_HORWE|nr:hypothetical protein D0864_13517 [Hortaea werneckii]